MTSYVVFCCGSLTLGTLRLATTDNEQRMRTRENWVEVLCACSRPSIITLFVVFPLATTVFQVFHVVSST